MIYCLLILAAMSIFIIAKDHHNQFNWTLAGVLVSVGMILAAILVGCMFYAPVYGYNSIKFFTLDRIIFSALRRILRVRASTVANLSNIAITLYTFSLFTLARQFHLEKRTFWISFGCINLLFWLFANILRNQDVEYLIFLIYHTDKRQIIVLLIYAAYYVYCVLLFAVMAFPLIMLWIYYRTIHSRFLRNQVMIISALVFLLNLFVLYNYLLGSLSIDIRQILLTSFWCEIGSSSYISSFEYVFWPVSTTILTVLTMITVCKYKRRGYFLFQKSARMNKTMDAVNENMKGLLHSYKNLLFTFQVYTIYIEKAQTEEQRVQALQKLQALEQESIAEVSRTLDNLRNVKNIKASSDLNHCIQACLEKIVVPGHIHIETPDLTEKCMINIPEYYMVRVLSNVINNAIEAMQYQDSGKIAIEIYQDQEYIFLKISNNGPAIPKDVQSGIFHSYYSTKDNNKNWGIGLSYVKRVIDNYYGHVWVESREDSDVQFCFLIEQPVQNRRNTLWKMKKSES